MIQMTSQKLMLCVFITLLQGITLPVSFGHSRIHSCIHSFFYLYFRRSLSPFVFVPFSVPVFPNISCFIKSRDSSISTVTRSLGRPGCFNLGKVHRYSSVPARVKMFHASHSLSTAATRELVGWSVKLITPLYIVPKCEVHTATSL
jgi:hypothetical protein